MLYREKPVASSKNMFSKHFFLATQTLKNYKIETVFDRIWGHDPNSKDKDELGHVPRFLSAYSLCNSDSNSISMNSYQFFKNIPLKEIYYV